MNKTLNESSEEAAEASKDLEPALKRPISQEDLLRILHAHQEWLDSDGTQGERANLSKTNLSELDLSGIRGHRAQLNDAYLRKCILRGANLNDTNLANANLNLACIDEGSLFGANLSGTSLILASLCRTDLQGADLRGANLNRANLEGAYLFGAKMHGAKINGANLKDANLSHADMTGASLVGATLYGALLVGTQLGEADLREAKLSGAVIQGAKIWRARLNHADFEKPVTVGESDLPGSTYAVGLKPAILSETSFNESDLSDAKLADVAGLQSQQLAGTNLSNAKLPDYLKSFEGLGHVEELCKHARNIFLGLIGSCVFSWLTIATTTDAALLTSSVSSPLPIIQTKIPISGFYLAAPLILLALYFYLHLYLQSLWESLASLPAIFPDGRKLDRRTYPWLLMSLVRRYVPVLIAHRQKFSTLSFAFSVIAAWGLVPFTIILFWFRYLPRQDGIGLTLLTTGIFVSAYWGIASFHNAKATLSSDTSSVKNPGLSSSLKAAVVALVTVPFSLMTMVADNQENLNLFGYHLYAEIEDSQLSEPPANWTGIGDKNLIQAQIARVKGARLKNANLRLVDAPGAFFVKANLSGANMEGANLRNADLREADLRQSNLTGAILNGASLGGANFEGADLSGVHLYGTDLSRVKGLHQTQLDDACGDSYTNLPEGISVASCPPE